MKQIIVLCAGLIAFSATASAGDLAQAVLPGYPAPVHPGYAAALPPHEVVTIVRSARMQPLHRPMRHGPTYVLRAIDPNGQEVRVIVDARLGRILQVVPVLGPRYAVLPPPYGRPPGLIPMMPDAPPPGVDGSPMTGPGLGGPPPAPASRACDCRRATLRPRRRVRRCRARGPSWRNRRPPIPRPPRRRKLRRRQARRHQACRRQPRRRKARPRTSRRPRARSPAPAGLAPAPVEQHE